MGNLFATAGLDAGYATARPPVHPRVIEKFRRQVAPVEKLNLVLDVGCGAGLSTGPLDMLARRVVGLEPAASMLRSRRLTAPSASFVAGRAEALPFRDASVDLITAAGSLNYVDLEDFFGEARRVLVASGGIAVYDFSPGRRFRRSDALEKWFAGFMLRYPQARDGARFLDPETLAEVAAGGFEPRWQERFEIVLTLDGAFYEKYMMTETNVAYAVAAGTPVEEIGAWCRETLGPVFEGVPREVIFEGYVAYWRRR